MTFANAGYICRQCARALAIAKPNGTTPISRGSVRPISYVARTAGQSSLPSRSKDVVARGASTRTQRDFSTSNSRWSVSSAKSEPQSTIDAQEVSHFSALASSWWDPHGPSRLLHLMNPLRNRFIQTCRASTSSSLMMDDSQAPDIIASGRTLHYLDIGCGGGIFAESAARLRDTASVTAIDPTKEVLAIAEKHRQQDPLLHQSSAGESSAAKPQLRYLNTAIEHLDAALQESGSKHVVIEEGKTSQFDVVTLFEVIEHVNSPSAFLEHATSHVKPGGWLILSTIARTPISYVVTKTFAEDLLRIVPRGTHEWSKYVNSEEILAWFGGANARYESSDGQSASGRWDIHGAKVQGVVYIPAIGWREIPGSEKMGNYFFGIRRLD